MSGSEGIVTEIVPRKIEHSEPLLIVISGPSGVGKDTVILRMKERNLPVHFVITATTRPPRDDEQNGVDYFFVSHDEFAEMIENDELLEYAVVYNDYKGITTAKVTTAVPFMENTRNTIITLVEEATKKKVELASFVDKNIIGGFILKVGDKQYDTTVSRKLEELKRVFSKNIYLKDY